MNSKKHRVGVDENYLVKRRLKVIEPDLLPMLSAVEEIESIIGIDSASFDEESHSLAVAYDASRICLDCIDEILEKHGVTIDPGWWNHFKEEYYRFVDKNVKDNSSHEPFSCHKVPPHK